jgi:hypothetical protein
MTPAQGVVGQLLAKPDDFGGFLKIFGLGN